jgi:hypothetical protein
VFAFGADGGGVAVTRVNDGGIGEGEKLFVDGFEDLWKRAAPQIGAADAAFEKCIAGEEALIVLVRAVCKVRRRVIRGVMMRRWIGAAGGGGRGGRSAALPYDQADTPGGVAGRVKDLRLVGSPMEDVAFLDEVLDGSERGSGDAEPMGLLIEMLVERQIGFVDEDGRAGGLVEGGEAANVVDVSVGADDGADFESVPVEDLKDGVGVVAGIHDDGFAGAGVAQDGAIAVEEADAEDFVDESVERHKR